MRLRLGIALGFTMLFAAGTAQAACESGTVQFADDFSRPHPSWSPLGNEAFRNGRYVMTVEPNGTVSDWPSAVRFSGPSTVCVKLILPFDPTSAAGSGVLFWIDPDKNARGGRNFYMAMISPDGFVWISRMFNGERTNVLEPVKSELVNTGPNAVNEIAVSVRDDGGVLTINGRSAGSFRGRPSPQWHAGLVAGAPLDTRYQVAFSDFRVVKP